MPVRRCNGVMPPVPASQRGIHGCVSIQTITPSMAAALDDPESVFYTYQQLIRLRHENDVIVAGRFEAIPDLAPAVMAYYRVLGATRWLVVANLSETRQPLDLNDRLEETILTNDVPLQSLTNQILQPYQAFAAIVRHV